MAAITIRPARLNDLPQVRETMEHYVRNTRLTFLQNPASQRMIDDKFIDITFSRGLPYLVAVQKDAKSGKEIVLGHTYLSPFRGHMLSYGPTVELSLFVHPDHQSHSIGSDLLAAVLEKAVDPAVRHRAREVVVDKNDQARTFYGAGENSVRIRNILAVMAVDPDGKDDGEALRRWYIKRGFVERGRMINVGFKLGKW